MEKCEKCGKSVHKAKVNWRMTKAEADNLMIDCPCCGAITSAELDSDSVDCNGCGHALVFQGF